MTQHTPEKLVSCPVCGRGNFTERGLKAHRCKAPKQALAVVENKPVDLDNLKNDTVSLFDPKLHGERVLAMMQHIEGLKKERAVKAILAGIYLAQIKAALGHGEFNQWCAKHLGNSKRSAERYMALAGRFSRSSKLLLPELVGANQLSLDLTNVKNDGGKAVLAKLDKFVGNLGLTELMQKHGVIQRGGYRPAPLPAPANDASAGREETEEEKINRAEVAAFEMCVGKVEDARKALLSDLAWADLTVESAKQIEAKLKQTLNEFQERIQQAKHERA